MICKKCNAEIPENAVACPNCGEIQNAAPATQLKTDRNFLIVLLLSTITFGIYSLILYAKIAKEVNLVCARDGKKTMNYYLLIFILTPVTFGIAPLVWMHKICKRMGDELGRRQINYNFGVKDYWLWGILGSIIWVGPFIFSYKFFTALNKLNENYNQFG